MSNACLRKINDSEKLPNLVKEWKYFVHIKHMGRWTGKVVFRRGACEDVDCECHKTEVKALNVMKIPRVDD